MALRRARAGAGHAWLAILVAASLCGCRRDEAPPQASAPVDDATKAELDALRRKNAALEREVKELRRALAAAEPAPTPAVFQRAAPGSNTPPQPAASVAASAWTVAKPWVDDAMQVQDAGRRAAAIESIRRALADQVPEQVAAALAAIPQIAQVTYDKAAMRELVLRHANSPDVAVRAAFPFALLNVGGPQPGDLDLVLPLTSDSESTVRSSAGRSLAFFTKGDLTGRAGESVLALLNDQVRQVRRDVLGSVWGAQVSPKIEERLLADFASPDAETRHQAFYFGISTLRAKSPAVVDACIAAMESSDQEFQWRARWGLAQGVPDDQRVKVGDAYLRLLAVRSDARVEQDAYDWLRQSGTAAHAAALDHLAENVLSTETARRGAKETAAAIRARLLR